MQVLLDFWVELLIIFVWQRFKLIGKSSLKGICKVWILQNMLIPRLCWPLLTYEISISVVNHLEQKICYFRKWLNIHHSTTNICLYFSKSPCPLSLRRLTLILKSTSQGAFVIKWDCRYTNWLLDVTEEFVDGESRLEFQKVIGYHQAVRAGFGLLKIPSVPHRNSPKHRRLISD